MKPLALTALFAAMLAAAAASAAPEEAEYATPPPQQILTSDLSGSDILFFTGAARQATLLSLLSDLAKAHAVTPQVQAVAAAVAKEQSAAAARLKELAGRKHVPLADEPDGEGKEQLQTLGKLDGVRFDKSYLDALQDTQEALETSLEVGAASSDKDIKAFATAGLGILKQERAQVRKLGI